MYKQIINKYLGCVFSDNKQEMYEATFILLLNNLKSDLIKWIQNVTGRIRLKSLKNFFYYHRKINKRKVFFQSWRRIQCAKSKTVSPCHLNIFPTPCTEVRNTIEERWNHGDNVCFSYMHFYRLKKIKSINFTEKKMAASKMNRNEYSEWACIISKQYVHTEG